MSSIPLIILDLIMAFIAYELFKAVFIPAIARDALYRKLKAKEKAELDKQIGLKQYFSATAVEDLKDEEE